MDLSGGTFKVPWRVRAGSMRALLLGMASEGGDLLFGQFPGAALGEASECDGADPDPLQVDQLQPHRSTRSTYYAVTPFMDGEVEGGCARGAAEVGEFRGEHLAVLEDGAGGEGGEASLRGRVLNGHFVFLLYL